MSHMFGREKLKEIQLIFLSTNKNTYSKTTTISMNLSPHQLSLSPQTFQEHSQESNTQFFIKIFSAMKFLQAMRF